MIGLSVYIKCSCFDLHLPVIRYLRLSVDSRSIYPFIHLHLLQS